MDEQHQDSFAVGLFYAKLTGDFRRGGEKDARGLKPYRMFWSIARQSKDHRC